MKLVTKRQARVGDLLARTIAEMIHRKIKDPRIDGVTITGVDVSMDLKIGRVFFCIHNEDNRDQAQQGLDSSAGYLRHELRKMLRLKNVPVLSFQYDTSFEYGSKIDSILEDIEKDEKPGS
ncbi:MAG TPA: 30S ribosome-binding factor RbfA [Deltaproteobacteria bacterium]|nr:30S ribosome-binding factor RbfA [Deltaproteobacteria bacterium]